MKRYNIIIILILSIISWNCSDESMDLFPKSELTDATFWKTEKDATMALAGCYGFAGPVDSNRGKDDNHWEKIWNLLWMDCIADNGHSQFVWDNVQVMGNGQVSPSNIGHDFWKYEKIRKYNNFLEKVENVEMDETKKEQYKAEVRFLRAYDYFKKMQWYGDVPLVTHTFVDPVEAELERDPKAKVLEFVLSELEAITSILPIKNNIESGGHVTRGAVLALKARIELYEGMFSEAMSDAKKVIDMGVYELYPDYHELFLPESEGSNKETILDVQYIKNDFPNVMWQHNMPISTGGWSSIAVEQSLVDAYETIDGKTIDDPTSGYDPDFPFKDRDPRLEMTVLYSGRMFYGRYFNTISNFLDEEGTINNPDYYTKGGAAKTGYNVFKYVKEIEPADRQNGDANLIVFRLAEMYLTYAEAAIELNMITDEMYKAINATRSRVNMPDVDKTIYNNQESLRELIRRERRVELAHEGLRYYDIKRWDIGAETLDGPRYGTRLGTVDPETGVVTYEGDHIVVEQRTFYPDRNYLMPIPQYEMDSNPNMVQNNGY